MRGTRERKAARKRGQHSELAAGDIVTRLAEGRGQHFARSAPKFLWSLVGQPPPATRTKLQTRARYFQPMVSEIGCGATAPLEVKRTDKCPKHGSNDVLPATAMASGTCGQQKHGLRDRFLLRKEEPAAGARIWAPPIQDMGVIDSNRRNAQWAVLYIWRRYSGSRNTRWSKEENAFANA